MKSAIVLLLLGAALIYGSMTLGGSARDELVRYEAVTSSAAADVSQVQLTEVDVRETRGRRGRVTTRYCPVFTPTDSANDASARTHRAHYLCTGDEDRWKVGLTGDLYTDVSGYPAFFKHELSERSIKDDINSNRWITALGVGTSALGLLILITSIRSKTVARREKKAEALESGNSSGNEARS